MMSGMNNMERVERIVSVLPEAERVDIEAWGDHPMFRVRGKNFIFADCDMARPSDARLGHRDLVGGPRFRTA